MQKVLIALDYNPTAQKVAEQGFSLAKAMNARVVLLHVISDPVFYSANVFDPIMGFGGFVDNSFLDFDMMEVILNGAKDFLEKTKAHLGDADIQVEVEQGDVADVILEIAQKTEAAFIVMGTHSQSWLEETVIGSTAHKVMKHSSIPLYIIPTQKHKQNSKSNHHGKKS